MVLEKYTINNTFWYRLEKGHTSVNCERNIMQLSSERPQKGISYNESIYKIRVLVGKKMPNSIKGHNLLILTEFAQTIIRWLCQSNMPNMSILAQTVFPGFWKQTLIWVLKKRHNSTSTRLTDEKKSILHFNGLFIYEISRPKQSRFLRKMKCYVQPDGWRGSQAQTNEWHNNVAVVFFYQYWTNKSQRSKIFDSSIVGHIL